MIPIKYNGSNWVICSKDDEDWYNYTQDITGDGKEDTNDFQWANVMLSDGTYKGNTATVGTVITSDSDLGSMFVWIPRYAYSFNKYKTAIDETTYPEGTTQNITNVTFLKGNSNKDKDGNQYFTDYSTGSTVVGQPTQKIVHPAFKFGDDNLTGIWSAKFEASMLETNTNDENNNVTTKNVKVVPNAESWRYIQIGNMFTNCLNMNKTSNIYGLTSSTDSHLMKNSEWGALAYLATSQYGVTPTRNSSGVKYGTTNDNGTDVDQYHSYSAGSGSNIGGNYKANTSQSTTGNVTGVYDLNGGAWEYVAAYWNNENGNLSGQGTSTYFEGNKLKAEYAKYWDKYEVSENEITQMNAGLWNLDNTYNNVRKQITEERYNLMKNIKGDALYEVINTWSYNGKLSDTDQTYSWLMDESSSTAQYGRSYYNSDHALIGNCLLPFLIRGGRWGSGDGSGVFYSSGSSGSANNHHRVPSGFDGGVVQEI